MQLPPECSESTPDLSAKDTIQERKRKLTVKIKKQLRYVEKGKVTLAKGQMHLAHTLIQLRDVFISSSTNQKRPREEFYKHLEMHFNMGSRSYLYYQRYFKFLSKYQRFQLVPVSFTKLSLMIHSIEKWFKTEECSHLSPNNFSSESFWQGNISGSNPNRNTLVLDPIMPWLMH